MTIESQLAELIDVNKAILAALQSGAQVAGAAPAAAGAADGKKPRTTKTKDDAKEEGQKPLPVVAGDPEGTRYFVSEQHKQVFAQTPGTDAPTDMSFKIETADHYLKKKAEFDAAKNASAAAAANTSQANAASEPSATADQGTASGASSAAEPTWDETVAVLKKLAADPAHGSSAVVALMTSFKSDAKAVNDLKALGKNAEIVAAVNAKLNPPAAAGGDPLFG